MIVVSHDRDFLTGLADKVYEFAHRNMKEYLGGVTDFLEAKKISCFREYEQLHKPQGQPQAAAAPPAAKESKMSFEERKQLNREIKKAEQAVEKTEQQITTLEAQVAEMEQQMAAGSVSEELLGKYSSARQALEEAMEEWTKATEEAERLKALG